MQRTLEIFRLLKPDGFFIMLGALNFTILDFKTNKKFHEILDNADKIIIDRGYNKKLQINVPDQIDKYMYNRTYFKYTLEFVLLGREKLTVDRFIGRLKTLGEIATCIKNNSDEISVQIVNFQKYIEEKHEDKSINYFTSYEMKVGQK